MDAPKRYVATDLDPPMREDPIGAWIYYDDHARIVVEKDARIAELEKALGKSVAAANLRDTYNQLPPDRNRIGDKKSPRSRARDIWLRALRKAEVSARAALKGDDNG